MSLFQGNHPCIRTFLEKISLDAANQKFNTIKALKGKNKSRKKYRVLNENIKNMQKISKLMSHIYVHLLTIHIAERLYLLYVSFVVLSNKFFKKSITRKLEELES